MAVKAGCDGGFDGLCCRMVIETKRVFDGCRFTGDNTTLTLTAEESLPERAEFVGARVLSSELVGYTVCDGCDNRSKVCGELVTRFSVTYSLDGVCHSVRATQSECREVMLRLPTDAVVPYSIDVLTVFNPRCGTRISPNAISVTGCLVRVFKVTATVDILVPTYGYCNYPPCSDCTCSRISPLFPFF